MTAAVSTRTRNTLWLSSSTIAVRGAQLLALVAAAASLGPTEFGQFAVAGAITAVFAMLAEAGLTESTTAEPHLTPAQEAGLARHGLAAGVLSMLLAIGVGYLVSLRAGMESVPVLTAALSSTMPLLGVAGVAAGRLQRLGAFPAIARAQLVAAFAGAVAAAVLLVLGHSLLALVAMTVVATGGTAVALIVHPGTRIRPAWGRTTGHPGCVRRSRYATGTNLVGAVGKRASDLLMGVVLGAAAAGQFAMANRVLTVAGEVVLYPLERITLSELSAQAKESPTAVLALARRRQRQIAVTAAPLFVLVGVAALFGIPRFLGPGWEQAAYAGAILAAAGVAQSCFNITYHTLFVATTAQNAFRYQMAAVAIVFVCTSAGIAHGVVGAALGSLLGTILAWAVARSFCSAATTALERRDNGTR